MGDAIGAPLWKQGMTRVSIRFPSHPTTIHDMITHVVLVQTALLLIDVTNPNLEWYKSSNVAGLWFGFTTFVYISNDLLRRWLADLG